MDFLEYDLFRSVIVKPGRGQLQKSSEDAFIKRLLSFALIEALRSTTRPVRQRASNFNLKMRFFTK